MGESKRRRERLGDRYGKPEPKILGIFDPSQKEKLRTTAIDIAILGGLTILVTLAVFAFLGPKLGI